LQRVLVVGSFLRKDHPLFAQRLRQAARRGAKIVSLHAVHDDWLMPVAQRLTAAPSDWVQALADIACAVAESTGAAPPMAGTATEAARATAATLLSGERKAVLLGNAAVQHPQAAELLALARWIGAQTGASVGVMGEAANSVGAQLVDAVPGASGLDVAGMLAQPRKALLLLNVEPVLDLADPAAAHAALQQADMVVAFTSFKDAAVEGADVLLPIAPFTETSGTFVNAEGRVQGFHGVVKPLGDTRPAWKVLRVLGNLLGLSGFEFETTEQVRQEALGDEALIPARLSNDVAVTPKAGVAPQGLQRLAEVPIYATDALVRRATSLQLTTDARAPQAGVAPGLWAALDFQAGDKVRVSQGAGSAVLPARLEPTLAEGTVRVPAGHPDTVGLGAMTGALSVERVAPAAQAAQAQESGVAA
jgi:NADH-quinone oxidoreductase subunit G